MKLTGHSTAASDPGVSGHKVADHPACIRQTGPVTYGRTGSIPVPGVDLWPFTGHADAIEGGTANTAISTDHSEEAMKRAPSFSGGFSVRLPLADCVLSDLYQLLYSRVPAILCSQPLEEASSAALPPCVLRRHLGGSEATPYHTLP